MELRTLAINGIDRAHYNPRVTLRPGDREYEGIKASLKEFGLVQPLVWNQRSNRLVGGHQRLSILEAQGETEVPFVVVDLDDAKEQLLNLALNNAQGKWDEDKLALMVRDLNREPGWEATAFDMDSVNRILRQFDNRHQSDFLNDVLSPPQPEQRSPGVSHTPADSQSSVTIAVTSAAPQHPGAQFFNLTFALTAQQRETVSEALAVIKGRQGFATTNEALVYLCEQAR